MPLKLPRLAAIKPSMCYAVGNTLASAVASRPQASTTFTFYEELDAWLGPWGAAGYPIGYGKKYNIAFTSDPILTSNAFPVTSRWVRQTGINLQLAIVDNIVDAVRSNLLYRLTAESEIRSAAFASHPGAYLRGGLLEVAAREPECIPVIAMIPYEQFNPSNPNFGATFQQVLDVIAEPTVKDWLWTVLRGGVSIPTETHRLLVLRLENQIREMGERVAATRRAALTAAQKALLKPFVDLADRYNPLRRYIH